VPVAETLNFADPGIFKLNRLIAPRPPLLRDYLDTAIAEPVSVRAADQALRVAINFDLTIVPRPD
jgi:hypothetical protein